MKQFYFILTHICQTFTKISHAKSLIQLKEFLSTFPFYYIISEWVWIGPCQVFIVQSQNSMNTHEYSGVSRQHDVMRIPCVTWQLLQAEKHGLSYFSKKGLGLKMIVKIVKSLENSCSCRWCYKESTECVILYKSLFNLNEYS